jgi:transposase
MWVQVIRVMAGVPPCPTSSLSPERIELIKPFPLRSHSAPCVNDRCVLSGIVFVITNGLHSRDAPVAYERHMTPYNSFIDRSRLGVFDRISIARATASDTQKTMFGAATTALGRRLRFDQR